MIRSSISQFLVRSNSTPLPPDAKRLRISPAAFSFLCQKLHVPAAFVAALSRYYQTCGTGFRELSGSWDYWCLLPVRVAVPCNDIAAGHTRSTAGSNQMDPFHYIHLFDVHFDIRGSHIAMFTRHDTRTKATKVVVISFLDGRWSAIAEEPVLRVREAIKSRGNAEVQVEPACVHLIYLSSILRWWNNVLSYFNNQLIAHVGCPQPLRWSSRNTRT